MSGDIPAFNYHDRRLHFTSWVQEVERALHETLQSFRCQDLLRINLTSIEEENMATTLNAKKGVETQRLEWRQEGSNKFWIMEIDWDDRKYRTRWGRIGTTGRISHWKTPFGTRWTSGRRGTLLTLQNVTDGLVTTKVRKGYIRIATSELPQPPGNEQVEKSTDVRRDPLYLW